METCDGYTILLGINKDTANRLVNIELGSLLLRDMGIAEHNKQLCHASILRNGQYEIVPAIRYLDSYRPLKEEGKINQMPGTEEEFIKNFSALTSSYQQQLLVIFWADYLLWNTERTMDTLFVTNTLRIVAETDGSLFDDKSSVGVFSKLDDVYKLSTLNPLEYFKEPNWNNYTYHTKASSVEQVKRRFAMMKKVWKHS